LEAEQWIPSPKDFFQFFIQDLCPSAQLGKRPQGPVHLFRLDEALVDHLIDRGFHERRAGRFTMLDRSP
jgi:hypothetical protein